MNLGKIAYLAVTEKGKVLAKKLQGLVGSGEVYTTAKLEEEGIHIFENSLQAQVGALFKQYDYLIFIMATGIVVRSIAPYIKDKLEDPAILVLDEAGEHVISLLSGHMGSANEMTHYISQLIQADPVITTSTDVNNKSALDNIAKALDAYIDDFKEAVKEINYKLVHNKKIGLYIDGDYEVDARGFIKLAVEDQLMTSEEAIDRNKMLAELEAVVYITHKKELKIKHPRIIKVVPRDIVIGMGCKKGTDESLMIHSFRDYMNKKNIDLHAIKKIGSIEIKKDEKAMLALAKDLGVPFETITKEDILKVEHLFDGSEFVKKNVGVYSVAEPVAYLLSGQDILFKREKYEGITFAVGRLKQNNQRRK